MWWFVSLEILHLHFSASLPVSMSAVTWQPDIYPPPPPPPPLVRKASRQGHIRGLEEVIIHFAAGLDIIEPHADPQSEFYCSMFVCVCRGHVLLCPATVITSLDARHVAQATNVL